jgi:hypothetical protein
MIGTANVARNAKVPFPQWWLTLMEPTCAPLVDILAVELGTCMHRAEEYRRYAAECLRVAHQSNDPNDKSLLLEMAQRWRELADRVERQNGNSP